MKALALVVTLAVSMQLNLGSDVPTEVPTEVPPTPLPSEVPSPWSSLAPSVLPSTSPSEVPTEAQTTQLPSAGPTESPTIKPSFAPSEAPTVATVTPTAPTSRPTSLPTSEPSSTPTVKPTVSPSSAPTNPTSEPSVMPSSLPSNSPSTAPSMQPTGWPTSEPSGQPSFAPTSPSGKPTAAPSDAPSSQPSNVPSMQPTNAPSGSPTNQPSAAPTSPTSMPSSQPTGIIEGPGLPAEVNPFWMYGDVHGAAHIVLYVWTSFLAVVSSATMLKKDREQAKNIRIVTGVVGLISASLLDYIILCARFNFLNVHRDTYPASITPDGNLFFPGPWYYSASINTLVNNDCPVSVQYVNTTYSGEDLEFYHHSASSSSCHLIYSFNAQLVREGAAQFSLAIGLMIFFFYQSFIVLVESKLLVQGEEERHVEEVAAIEANNGRDLNLVQKFIGYIDGMYVQVRYHPRELMISLIRGCVWSGFKYFACLILLSQQALVLLPLTAIGANHYCLQIFVPTSTTYAICLYKFAVWAIPLMLIHLPIGVLGYGFARAEINQGEDRGVAMFLKLLGALVAMYCAVVFLIYFVYYVFAGFFIGIWFELSQFHFTRRIAVPQFISMSLFLYNDILNFISNYGVATGGYQSPTTLSGKTIDTGIEMPATA